MALSEFSWAKDAESWDTVTLQQFERLRTEGSSASGAAAVWPWNQQAKRRQQPRRPTEPRTKRRRPSTTRRSTTRRSTTARS